MRNKHLVKYYEENKKNINENKIKEFLIDNNIFKSEYFDINKDEIIRFVNSKSTVKYEKKINKVSEISKELKLIIKNNLYYDDSMKDIIKETFNRSKNNIFNYSNIDISLMFDLKNLEYNISYFINKYLIFIKIDNIVVFASIIDLFDIYLENNNYNKTFEYIDELFNYNEIDRECKNNYRKKINEYKKNIKKIDNKEIKTITETYFKILDYSISNYNNLSRDAEDDYYFFISKNKIAELTKKSASTALNHINYLCLIGLLENVSYDSISPSDADRINKNNKFNNVRLFKLKTYNKHIIEKNINTFEELNLSIRKINKDTKLI